MPGSRMQTGPPIRTRIQLSQAYQIVRLPSDEEGTETRGTLVLDCYRPLETCLILPIRNTV